MSRLTALVDLVFDVVDETTSLVERTHASVAERTTRRIPFESVGSVVKEVASAQQAIAHGVYQAIREVNHGVRVAVGQGAKAASGASDLIASSPADASAQTLSWGVAQLQALLNGVHGDYLAQRKNPLAWSMHLRRNNAPVPLTREGLAKAYPKATPKICVFVHGLACTEWAWSIRSEEFYGDPSLDFGTRLQRDCAYTPIYVRYNSGLPIDENGLALSRLVAALVELYPVPLEEIAVIGHSMGGLVACNAVRHAHRRSESWTQKLRHVFCIGSPHLGAPLEQTASVLANVLEHVDTAATQVCAELLQARSLGIKDLRRGHGALEKHPDLYDAAFAVDDMPTKDVNYYSLAATFTKDPKHPLGQLLGDWLVRPASATGSASNRRLPFHARKVFGGIDHVSLINHPEVYAAVRDWLDASQRS